jgi:hypothetical protein
MAHFAQLDSNNIVTTVLVVNNEIINNAEGLDGEALGVSFLKSLYGENTEWRQTSYNKNFRGRYAGAGMVYDPIKDEFTDPTQTPTV